MLMCTNIAGDISLPGMSLRYGFEFGIFLVYLTWSTCRKNRVRYDKKNGRLQFS